MNSLFTLNPLVLADIFKSAELYYKGLNPVYDGDGSEPLCVVLQNLCHDLSYKILMCPSGDFVFCTHDDLSLFVKDKEK